MIILSVVLDERAQTLWFCMLTSCWMSNFFSSVKSKIGGRRSVSNLIKNHGIFWLSVLYTCLLTLDGAASWKAILTQVFFQHFYVIYFLALANIWPMFGKKDKSTCIAFPSWFWSAKKCTRSISCHVLSCHEFYVSPKVFHNITIRKKPHCNGAIAIASVFWFILRSFITIFLSTIILKLSWENLKTSAMKENSLNI